MTVIGEAFIDVKPKTDSFEKDTTSAFGKVAKTAAAAFAGAFAVKGAVDFFGGLIADATESQKVAKQTEAALKSTGNAAKVSAGQIGDLATAISNKTGIDDEAIQSGENLLLTFTNIRNEAGKGNDVFNQASKTLVDMGAALGGGPTQSAIQLGKALNDPVQGITALTRVGVTFTDQQKDQIKAMVEAGNVAGAQKVILAELNKEFGGSAEAQATVGDKLKVTWGNVREELGGKLLPIFNAVGQWLADRLPGYVDKATAAFDRIGAYASQLFNILFKGDFRGGPFSEDSKIVDIAFRVRDTMRQIIGVATQLFNVLFKGDFRGGPLSEDSGIIDFAFRLRDVLMQVGSFIADHWQPLLIAAGVALGLLFAPITTIVGGLILLYERFDAVRTVVDAVVQGIIAAAGYIGEQVGHLIAYFQSIAPAVEEAMGHVLAVVQAVLDVILAAWNLWGDNVLSYVKAIFELIRAAVDTAIRIVRDVINTVLALINGDWGKAWDAIKDIPAALLGLMVTAVKSTLEGLSAILSGVMEGVARVWGVAWDGIKTVAGDAVGAVVGFFRDLPGKITGMVGDVATAATSIGSTIFHKLLEGIGDLGAAGLGLAKGAADLMGKVGKGLINGVIQAINDMLPNSVGKVEVAGHTIFPGIDLPDDPIPKLRAMGGPVSKFAPYIVGEKGPELFVPSQAGFIVPNDKLRIGSVAVTTGGGPLDTWEPAGHALVQGLQTGIEREASTLNDWVTGWGNDLVSKMAGVATAVSTAVGQVASSSPTPTVAGLLPNADRGFAVGGGQVVGAVTGAKGHITTADMFTPEQVAALQQQARDTGLLPSGGRLHLSGRDQAELNNAIAAASHGPQAGRNSGWADGNAPVINVQAVVQGGTGNEREDARRGAEEGTVAALVQAGLRVRTRSS